MLYELFYIVLCIVIIKITKAQQIHSLKNINTFKKQRPNTDALTFESDNSGR